MRKAIVTGAYGAIGKAIAKGVAEAAYDVTLVGRDEAALEACRGELADQTGNRHHFLDVDRSFGERRNQGLCRQVERTIAPSDKQCRHGTADKNGNAPGNRTPVCNQCAGIFLDDPVFQRAHERGGRCPHCERGQLLGRWSRYQ